MWYYFDGNVTVPSPVIYQDEIGKVVEKVDVDLVVLIVVLYDFNGQPMTKLHR